ncbi:MAG: 50S ribosomal protein L18 [Candidatus Niyogibacteria bacterium]|nr:50S ribosomal protein L18 [Candidatus Niyogibacteria bacterium]
MTTSTTKMRRIRRHIRVRSRVEGTSKRPRLSVFRSSKYIYAQLVDDNAARTLIGMSDRSLAKNQPKAGRLRAEKMTKTERARAFGEAFAKKAREANIIEVVFDRGGFSYHGRTQAFAEGARKGGLKF